MRVCILSAVNIKHMSLITLYTKLLKENGIDYDIIYMDKYGEHEAFECTNKYCYVNVIKPKWPFPYKAVKYMTFRRFATRIINRERYDFIIVWNDVAIFIFADYLAKKFKNKYCLNVRDNMMYDKKCLKKRYENVFRNAAFCTTSSVGYSSFLPKNIDYIPIHSFNSTILQGMKVHHAMRKVGQPIRIGFIGYVRFIERNKKLLQVFANDPRFELHYYGKNANILQQFAREQGIHNTAFHDSFPVEETKNYLEKIDIINNLYGNDTVNLRNAISIKFYHALYARIPILVCDNTFVGELAKEVGIGFEVVQIDQDMKERLYVWYNALDFKTLDRNCKEYLDRAVVENEQFEKTVLNFLNS